MKFFPVYFNSATKTIINNRFKAKEYFQEILYRIDGWINKGSGWIIESIESQYINITTYRTLVGSSYIDFPIKLRVPKKDLSISKIKIRNAFYGVMLGILILQKNIQEKLRKLIYGLLIISTMMELSFLCKKTILPRLKYKIIFLLMYLAVRISWSLQFMFLIKNTKMQWIHCF